MLALPEAWVWDFWLADDGQDYHLFFLYASRAIGDPDGRHHRASIGHAVSTDLVRWERVVDALVRSDPPAFDDLATWTGSVIRDPDGTWFMFYTGATLTEAGNVQTIGYATSTDLYRWTKNPDNPVLRADPQWYEKLADSQWHDEAFRDPFVFADPDDHGYHMLITARANHGAPDDRGVVGHAWSADLRHWEPRPPLTGPGQGFGQLEVTQVEVIDRQPLLLFSCLSKDMSAAAQVSGTPGGVWYCRAESLLGPFDLPGVQLLADRTRYVGRFIKNRVTGQWMVLTFLHDDAEGKFVGEISDPTYVQWRGDQLVETCSQGAVTDANVLTSH